MKKWFLIAAVLCWICGCGSINDTLTLKSDGSGVFTRTMVLLPATVEVMKLSEKQQGMMIGMVQISPSTTEEGVNKAFNSDGMTVEGFKSGPDGKGMVKIHYTVKFNDIHKLVKAGFSQALGLEITDAGDNKVKVSQGVFQTFRPMMLMGGNQKDAFSIIRLVGRGFEYSFVMEMPGPIEKTNGIIEGDRKVTWAWKVSDLQADDLTDSDGVVANPNAIIKKGAITFKLPVKRQGFNLFGMGRPVPPKTAEKKPVKPLTKAEKGDFQFEVESIQSSHSVQFESNVPVHDYSNNSLQLSVIYPRGFMPISTKNVKVDKILTDTGEDIKEAGRQSRWGRSENPINMYSYGFRERQELKFSIRVSYKDAKKKYNAIKELSGSFTLKYASSAGKEVTIKPIGDWVEKRLEGEGLKDRNITIKSMEGGKIAIEFDNKDIAELKEIRFLSKGNVPIRDDMMGGMIQGMSMSGNTTTRNYSYKGGKEGILVLVFYDKIETMSVPFSLKNITLKSEGGGKKGWDEGFDEGEFIID